MIVIRGKPLPEYLRSRTITEGDCWVWIGATMNTGYGAFNYRGTVFLAHRKAYECFVGPIPTGLHVLHKCDNRACINPNHLYAGTDLDNSRDKIARDRQSRGTTHGASKLTEDDVRRIRLLYEVKSLNQYELAEMFGVNQAAISRLVNRKSYTDEQELL